MSVLLIIELLKTTEHQMNTSVSSAGINGPSAPPNTTAVGQTINQVGFLHATLLSIIAAASSGLLSPYYATQNQPFLSMLKVHPPI